MEKEFVTVCSVCGFPLEEKEVKGIIAGHLHVDVGEGQENRFAVTMHMCIECTRKVANYTTMGVEEAQKRLAELDNYG